MKSSLLISLPSLERKPLFNKSRVESCPTYRGNPDTTTAWSKALSGTSTTRFTTTPTTRLPKSYRATSSTFSTQSSLTSQRRHSSISNRAARVKTLSSSGSKQAPLTRTSPSRSWTASGKWVNDTASGVRLTEVSCSFTSTSNGTATGGD
jgi:hypothetical protein